MLPPQHQQFFWKKRIKFVTVVHLRFSIFYPSTTSETIWISRILWGGALSHLWNISMTVSRDSDPTHELQISFASSDVSMICEKNLSEQRQMQVSWNSAKKPQHTKIGFDTRQIYAALPLVWDLRLGWVKRGIDLKWDKRSPISTRNSCFFFFLSMKQYDRLTNGCFSGFRVQLTVVGVQVVRIGFHWRLFLFAGQWFNLLLFLGVLVLQVPAVAKKCCTSN